MLSQFLLISSSIFKVELEDRYIRDEEFKGSLISATIGPLWSWFIPWIVGPWCDRGCCDKCCNFQRFIRVTKSEDLESTLELSCRIIWTPLGVGGSGSAKQTHMMISTSSNQRANPGFPSLGAVLQEPRTPLALLKQQGLSDWTGSTPSPVRQRKPSSRALPSQRAFQVLW